MSKEFMDNIDISDEDIDWVENILKNISFDECRRNIIKNMNTIDIQAFPGTGKTTVLVAKLAILAKKWNDPYRGICVLSHTNVARDEIVNRLGNTEIGDKLLNYPHFIGTIQSFFDTFVCLPWLRSYGTKVKIIDSFQVTKIRWERLSYNTKYYLSNKSIGEECCQATSLPIKVSVGKLGTETKTYKEILSIVSASIKAGEFTFDEMMLFANEALTQCKTFSKSIITRYPIIFIDEAQDTKDNQWILLNKAYPKEDSFVRQCFGDTNQAIFSSYNVEDVSNSFPNETPINIIDSKRFGPKIAFVANHLSISQQKMIGTSDFFSKNTDKNTIFLFDRDSSERVISNYVSLILSIFTEQEILENEHLGCHIIGMVHRENEYDPAHFPQSVHDYWEKYDSNYSTNTKSPEKLIDYFQLGHNECKLNGETAILIDWISKGIRRFLNMFNNRSIPVNTDALRSLCKLLSEDKVIDLRKSLLFLSKIDINSEDDWQSATNEIMITSKEIFGLTCHPNEFMQWRQLSTDDLNSVNMNVMTYYDTNTGRVLPLHFGSIHSVKGRTHLSTLVVETFWYKHNISSILPLLCGSPLDKKLGKQMATRMKCHYVAVTRARTNLCLALPKVSVSLKQISELKENGWKVVDVTC